MKFSTSYCLKKVNDLRIVFVYIISLFFLSSCGLKGPLYMPPAEDPNATNIEIKQKTDDKVSIKDVNTEIGEKEK